MPSSKYSNYRVYRTSTKAVLVR